MTYSIKSLPGKMLLVAIESDKEETSKSGIVTTLNNDKTPFVVGKVVVFGDGIDIDIPTNSLSDRDSLTFETALKGKRALFPRQHGTVVDKVGGCDLKLFPMTSLVAILAD